MRIAHTEEFGWLDLDHIQCVGDPFFIDRMGSGGYFAGFKVWLMFRNEPLEYIMDISSNPAFCRLELGMWMLKMFDGQWLCAKVALAPEHRPNLACFFDLKRRIAALVDAWKEGV